MNLRHCRASVITGLAGIHFHRDHQHPDLMTDFGQKLAVKKSWTDADLGVSKVGGGV